MTVDYANLRRHYWKLLQPDSQSELSSPANMSNSLLAPNDSNLLRAVGNTDADSMYQNNPRHFSQTEPTRNLSSKEKETTGASAGNASSSSPLVAKTHIFTPKGVITAAIEDPGTTKPGANEIATPGETDAAVPGDEVNSFASSKDIPRSDGSLDEKALAFSSEAGKLNLELELIFNKQQHDAKAGLERWEGHFEAAQHHLNQLEPEAIELQGRLQKLNVEQQEACQRESHWQHNFYITGQIPWKDISEGSSCGEDPSLEKFREKIREKVDEATEQTTRLGRDIDALDIRQRVLEERIVKAKELVAFYSKGTTRWKNYVEHLCSFT